MRTSSKFVLAGIIVVLSFIVNMLFFNTGLEIISFIGYAVFILLVLWIVHGILAEEKGRKTHRLEEFITHPFLMFFLLLFGIAMLLLAIYNIFMERMDIVLFLLMLEISVLFILLAYNNIREGRKRGHW
ncbi:MAG: hypothetical protein HZB67_05720 [Candidatus Aenigmarchaeota archaeon]|nr:hypothetical protein [Candidatus Aenigmarchaeota archaeon]